MADKKARFKYTGSYTGIISNDDEHLSFEPGEIKDAGWEINHPDFEKTRDAITEMPTPTTAAERTIPEVVSDTPSDKKSRGGS